LLFSSAFTPISITEQYDYRVTRHALDFQVDMINVQYRNEQEMRMTYLFYLY